MLKTYLLLKTTKYTKIMVYMRVKITVTDKELVVNPNCPIKLLYNFIQMELVAANTKQIFSDSKLSLDSSTSLASVQKKEGSISTKALTRRSNSKSSTGNKSVSKTSSVLARPDMPADQEFDLCDEKGNMKQIYSLDPWVNGWETGLFMDRATYFVVTFERDEKGSLLNLQPMLPKSYKNYGDLLLKIRRQSRTFSKQKLEDEKV